MVTAAFHIGDTKRLTAAFTVADVATDPTTLSFVIREPDGLATSYISGTDVELVNNSVGNYHVDWPIAKAGRHFYTWLGTGAAAEAGQGEFYALDRKAG